MANNDVNPYQSPSPESEDASVTSTHQRTSATPIIKQYPLGCRFKRMLLFFYFCSCIGELLFIRVALNIHEPVRFLGVDVSVPVVKALIWSWIILCGFSVITGIRVNFFWRNDNRRITITPTDLSLPWPSRWGWLWTERDIPWQVIRDVKIHRPLPNLQVIRLNCPDGTYRVSNWMMETNADFEDLWRQIQSNILASKAVGNSPGVH